MRFRIKFPTKTAWKKLMITKPLAGHPCLASLWQEAVVTCSSQGQPCVLPGPLGQGVGLGKAQMGLCSSNFDHNL